MSLLFCSTRLSFPFCAQCSITAKPAITKYGHHMNRICSSALDYFTSYPLIRRMCLIPFLSTIQLSTNNECRNTDVSYQAIRFHVWVCLNVCALLFCNTNIGNLTNTNCQYMWSFPLFSYYGCFSPSLLR